MAIRMKQVSEFDIEREVDFEERAFDSKEFNIQY